MREPGDENEETIDDGESMDDAERVVLVDDQGVEHTLIVVAVVEVEGQDYAMLVEDDAEAAEDEEVETPVYLFTYAEDDEGNATLGEIDDEATYDKVFEVCATLMDLEEEDEADA